MTRRLVLPHRWENIFSAQIHVAPWVSWNSHIFIGIVFKLRSVNGKVLTLGILMRHRRTKSRYDSWTIINTVATPPEDDQDVCCALWEKSHSSPSTICAIYSSGKGNFDQMWDPGFVTMWKMSKAIRLRNVDLFGMRDGIERSSVYTAVTLPCIHIGDVCCWHCARTSFQWRYDETEMFV